MFPSRRAALGLVATLPVLAHAQASTAPIAPMLKRGVGVHLPLNWPEVFQRDGKIIYTWPAFQGERYAVSDGDLRLLSQLGFDFIRLTVDPGIFIDVAGTERAAIIDAQMRALVQRMQTAGFSVIVDLHPVAVSPVYAPRALVHPGAPAFAAYCDMVERLAKALNDLPHDKTVFELMNEPWIDTASELPRWQSMLETLHLRARKVAPELPLILTGAMWSDWSALVRLDTKPFRGSNVYYTFHYYEPHSFTHQGVPGDYTQFLAGLPWPTQDAAVAGLFEAANRRIEVEPNVDPVARARLQQIVARQLRKRHDASQVHRHFAGVRTWALSNGVAPERVLLGEFGCVTSAGDARLRWIETVRLAAEKERMPWCYWNWKGWGGMALIDPIGSLDAAVIAPLGLTSLQR